MPCRPRPGGGLRRARRDPPGGPAPRHRPPERCSPPGWRARRSAGWPTGSPGRSFDGRPVRAWSLDPPAAGTPERRDGACGSRRPVPTTRPSICDERADRHCWTSAGAARPVTVRMDGPHPATGPGRDRTGRRLRVDDASAGAAPAARPAPNRRHRGVRVSADRRGHRAGQRDRPGGDRPRRTGRSPSPPRSGLRAEGLNRYVDGGDGGDTYTWCPPDVDTVIERPDSVTVDVEEAGPLRGRVVITATYEWPRAAEGDENGLLRRRSPPPRRPRSDGRVALGPAIRSSTIEAALDNRCRDHRLRVHFPLPVPVTGSDAGCAFAVVHRGLVAEGGRPRPRRRRSPPGGSSTAAPEPSGWPSSPTARSSTRSSTTARSWPSRCCGRRAGCHAGGCRCAPTRPGPAVPVEGAQVQGRRRWRYGLLLHAGDGSSRPSERAGRRLPAPARGRPSDPAAGPSPPARRPGAAGRGRRGVGGPPRRRRVVVRLFHPGSQVAPPPSATWRPRPSCRPPAGRDRHRQDWPASWSGIGIRAR